MCACVQILTTTVRHRGMGTGISEASKRFFLCYPGRQTNEFLFDRATGSKPEKLRSGFLQTDLSLIVWNDPSARVSAQAPRFLRLCVPCATRKSSDL